MIGMIQHHPNLTCAEFYETFEPTKDEPQLDPQPDAKSQAPPTTVFSNADLMRELMEEKEESYSSHPW